VLGLSLTSTAAGWVLVEGRDADGAIVDHDDLAVRTGGGTRAVKTAERVTAAVLRARALATRHDQRVHVIGLTWSDDVAAEAALLLESLTDAGFDNVVPIQVLQATEMFAQGVAPVVGYDETTVCVLDGESATVVMVDGADDQTQTAVKHLKGGPERLIRWLTTMFDRSAWQPSGVVVVGSDHDLGALSCQLEKALPVPVFTQSGAQMALARGAALASAQSMQFTDAELVESIDRITADPVPSRSRSYAGALTMLAVGAVAFVASLSLAVGPWLFPHRPTEPVEQVVHRSASPPVVATPAAPPAAVAAPTAQAAPEPAPAEQPVVAAPPIEQQSGVTAAPPADLPAAEPAPPPPPVAPPPPEPEPNPHPLLTKLLQRLHGQDSEPAPEEPPPAPPPDPGGPAP
ncbi:MAG: DUF7159 family protein, partial [Mycobacterium sp.]